MSKELKVGIFVLFGLILIGAGIFVIGENRNLWESKVSYTAAFTDVAGLKPGAPVRLGGVDVGNVVSVGHSEDLRDSRIYVKVSVVKHESSRVREDTVARVVTKGLLGDKMIELSVDGVGAQLEAGKMLKTEEPLDISKYVTKLEDITNKAGKAVENIELATRAFGDPRFAEDVKGSVGSLRVILEGFAKNDSAMHRLMLDPNTGRETQATIDQLSAAAADLHDVSQHVRSGPGIAHALVYDGSLSEHASGSLTEIHKDLEAIRQGNGLAHAIIYGDTDTQHVMGNVNALSDDLRHIVADIKAGKGTIGGLLVDPSIYEDIKSVVGNVERNEVLRALVRYSIKADEDKAAVAPPSSSK